MTQQVQINRDLQNDKFVNWRLGKEFLASRAELPLPGTLAVADTGAVNDYLHTRASVLHNHLQQSAGQVFICTSSQAASAQTPPPLSLWQVLPCSESQPPVFLHKLAELPACQLPTGTSLAAGACPADCSVAVVEYPAGSTHTAGMQLLLVSRGWGDVHLLHVNAEHQLQGISPAVFPLREHAPLTGVTPLRLEAAYINNEGVLRCVVWAVRSRTNTQPGACELYMLSFTFSTTSSTLQLGIQDIQLMATTVLPPHSVACNPAADAVLLGVDPSSLEVHHAHLTAASGSQGNNTASNGVAGVQTQGTPPQGNGAGNANGTGNADTTGNADGLGQRQMEVDSVEHIECRKPEWLRADDDDDECDVDPRTLAEAAARLAKYTSEEPVGNLEPQQWADLYKEGGPEDVSADVACDLLVWTAQPSTAAGAQHSWHLSCGAHKVLTSDTPGLLAITDDVDACVLTVGWGAVEGQSQPSVQHIATIPALAYIAAGKTQRKHLLLGDPSTATAPCSAVLVEGTKFYYVYGCLPGKQSHGYQQVVDMQLDAQERVLGAALLPGHSWCAGPVADNSMLLLILTNQRLLVHVLHG